MFATHFLLCLCGPQVALGAFKAEMVSLLMKTLTRNYKVRPAGRNSGSGPFRFAVPAVPAARQVCLQPSFRRACGACGRDKHTCGARLAMLAWTSGGSGSL